MRRSGTRCCPNCGHTITKTCQSGHAHESVAAAYDCDLLREMRLVLNAVNEGRLPMLKSFVARKYAAACKTTGGIQSARTEEVAALMAEDRARREVDLPGTAFLPWLCVGADAMESEP